MQTERTESGDKKGEKGERSGAVTGRPNFGLYLVPEVVADFGDTADFFPTAEERGDGIIKSEKLYREPIYKTIEEARKGIGKFISFYNNRRPHMSIGYKTPAQAHEQTGPQARLWKAYKSSLLI